MQCRRDERGEEERSRLITKSPRSNLARLTCEGDTQQIQWDRPNESSWEHTQSMARWRIWCFTCNGDRERSKESRWCCVNIPSRSCGLTCMYPVDGSSLLWIRFRRVDWGGQGEGRRVTDEGLRCRMYMIIFKRYIVLSRQVLGSENVRREERGTLRLMSAATQNEC